MKKSLEHAADAHNEALDEAISELDLDDAIEFVEEVMDYARVVLGGLRHDRTRRDG